MSSIGTGGTLKGCAVPLKKAIPGIKMIGISNVVSMCSFEYAKPNAVDVNSYYTPEVFRTSIADELI